MENISQALLMAAGILLAVLLILIAMILFKGGAGVTNAYQNSNEKNELNTFNSNFNKMLTGNGKKDTITIYDIITTANFAWNNNCHYVDDPTDPIYNNDSRMLRISICDEHGNVIIDNLQNYNQGLYDIIIKAGHFRDSTTLPQILYYQIDIAGYSNAGRINNVKFSPKTDPVAATQIDTALKGVNTADFKRDI